MNTRHLKNRFLWFAIVVVMFIVKEYFYPTLSNEQKLMRFGKETIGTIEEVRVGRTRPFIYISYSVGSNNYWICTDKFDNSRFLEKFILCSKDSNCFRECYMVRYVSYRPEIAAVDFNRPIINRPSQ